MRLVSLCPSLTELVFDLGAGDALVGRTKFCVHPAGAVERVEKVGGTKNPKVARIVELAPDLVLMNEEENRREDAEALAAAGLAVHVSFPRTSDETAATVRSIAEAIGRVDEGERIAHEIEVRSARVRERALQLTPVRYAYLIWREPWMAVSGDTFIDALLAQAGGRNVLAGHTERYPTVTPEEIAAASPDVVMLSTEPFPFKEKHIEELARLTGLPHERFRIVDGELLSWHGSRTIRGVDYAAELLDAVRESSREVAGDAPTARG